ncbi:transcriptional regulator [Vibrio lentus]|uniref:Transcriptional regulator n=3 Tax=Vibrio lentus TaxID=136468 RepID=A0AA44VU81_9VIBR|nr:winged helix-turn-helix domain-containing protein [Vibrio lentus]MCB5359659.1 transcriptional regulator [Vibrio lentus]MCB5450126.1 transcriptional regulator [Vibrio lentus]MCB5462043.1 transcriptional regulator [Vibrio lentus]MCC5483024.1 transcriptional regulator [Vibrio lentus]MCC5488906.1 transcriptional regulator [Vibrio lentus]
MKTSYKPMNHKSNITDQIVINNKMRTITQTLSDTTISVRPLPFKVLVYLLEHQGQCISREELFEECWQGVLVTDQSLTNTISYIRKVIKNLNTDELKLKTISKKGYSLSVTQNKQPQASSAPQTENRDVLEAMPENDILGDALGVGVEVEKSAYHLQQPINEEQVNPRFPHQFAISLCALWFGIILVAYYFIHYNNEQAPFLNKENYQPYQFGSATLYLSDDSQKVSSTEMKAYINGLERAQCNVKSIYIRVSNSAYRDNIASMYAFVFTNNRKSQNIFKQKLDNINIYHSIITPLLNSFYCKGSLKSD